MIKKITKKIRYAKGEIINGDLYSHPGSKKLILMCLGYGDKRTNKSASSFAKHLSSKGNNVFIFDFSEKTEIYDIARQVKQIICVIDHYKKYKDITLVGSSLGAMNATIVSASSKKVKQLVTVNGFFGLPLLNREMLKVYLSVLLAAILKKKNYRNIWDFYRSNLKFRKIRIPVLVIHSRDDKVVSLFQSKYFFYSLKTEMKTYREPKGLDHGLSRVGFVKEVVNNISDWL